MDRIEIVIFHFLNVNIACRSGACREDSNEQYGVALVAFRETIQLAGEVVKHELQHLFGMDHDAKGNIDSDLIDSWYAESGQRCYDKGKQRL